MPPSSPPGIAHGILAADAGPVGERRSGEQERADEIGLDGGRHHDLPAGLAVADEAGLALGLGMAFADLADERGLGAADILDRLARHGLGQEADEVAGMAGGERHADLAVVLHAADARVHGRRAGRRR